MGGACGGVASFDVTQVVVINFCHRLIHTPHYHFLALSPLQSLETFHIPVISDRYIFTDAAHNIFINQRYKLRVEY